jgi:molecular chaperone DnaK (HSP70)
MTTTNNKTSIQLWTKKKLEERVQLEQYLQAMKATVEDHKQLADKLEPREKARIRDAIEIKE